jgi:AcrR family transcriptional regulator
MYMSAGHQASRGQARQRLLAAGGDLFYAEGIHAVGVDKVAERAGVTKRTLYQHFPSKDALLAAVLEAQGRAWREWLEAELGRRAATPAGQLLAMFDVIAEESVAEGYRGCRFVNAAAEIPDRRHPARAVASEHKRAVLQLISVRTAQLAVADPAGLARQLKVLLEGAISTALVDPSAQAASDARRAAAVLLQTAVSGQQHQLPHDKGDDDGGVHRGPRRAGTR